MKQKMSGASKAFLTELIRKLEKVKEFNQSMGDFSPDCPCCVGAHIAYHLIDKINFADGRLYFYKRFMENDLWKEDDVSKTLHFCGASDSPFGPDAWLKHPADVFRNFLKLGRLLTDKEYSNWIK